MQPFSLNYTNTGSGRPVILIHGIAASLRDWDRLSPVLVEAGYRAIAVDLPGHGDSPHPQDPHKFGLKVVYTAFESWLDGCDLPDPVHLLGHSLGGYLGLRYALRRPERVQSLALINPLYCIAQITPGLHLFRRRPGLGTHLIRIAPAWLIKRALAWDPAGADSFPPEVRRQISEDYKRATPHFLNITRRIPDLTPELRRVPSPVLLLWGDRDRTLDPASFPLMAARLPRVEQHRLAGSGHQPHIGRPELVNRYVLRWLEAGFTAL
jgi:pimeloyl-ACP methyl ester carboxylesterase